MMFKIQFKKYPKQLLLLLSIYWIIIDIVNCHYSGGVLFPSDDDDDSSIKSRFSHSGHSKEFHDKFTIKKMPPHHYHDSHAPANKEFISQEQFYTQKKYAPLTGGYGGYGGRGRGRGGGGPPSKYDDNNCKPFDKPIMNAKLRCLTEQNVCKATCIEQFKYPNGKTILDIQCIGGEWSVANSELEDIPPCEPICEPACENNGICINPGQCNCPENYIGSFCENEKKLCLSPPPLPKNSRRSCSSTKCTISCATGYRFPDETTVTNMVCTDGLWTPTRPDMAIIPNCQPICTPKCDNGGLCISHDVCQCTQDYRGPRCQYSVDSCSPKRLEFNGAYNCSGDSNQIKCKLSCPKGIEFEFEPAEEYICKYEDATFLPSKVPLCKFSPDMEIIDLGGTSKTFYKTADKTVRTGQVVKKKKKTKKVYYVSGEDEEEDDDSWEKIITKIKIRIKKGKKKEKKKGKYYEEEEEEEEGEEEEENSEMPGVYSMYLTNDVDIKYRIPKPAVCMTWNGNKIKTFDGLTYTSDLYCSHTMVQDYVDGSFSVILRTCPYGVDKSICSNYALEIFLQNIRYTFDISDNDGSIRLWTIKKQLSIPSQLAGMKVTMCGNKLKISLEAVGLTVLWDADRMVTIEANAGLWNRTAGLCGTLDQDIDNDFMSKDKQIVKMATTFVDSWKATAVDTDSEKCFMNDEKPSATMELECSEDIQNEALKVCLQLIQNAKFEHCLKELDQESMLKTCLSDYCYCNKENKAKCACDGIAVFAKDCQFRGIILDNGWRDMALCPMMCPQGRIYNPCGPSFEPSCGSTTEDSLNTCTEGCFCPEGTLQHEGKCVEIDQCPCRLRGKTFKPGDIIKKDCNTCKCHNGFWKCSDETCGARCAVVGDPHHSTFDGKRFDFMGKCSYYLVATENYTIEGENVACPGSISGIKMTNEVELPSCTKSVTITVLNENEKIKTIKLKQGREVLIDGLEIPELPVRLLDGVVNLRQASSLMILVTFKDGLHVWWDGMTTVYIDAPQTYRGRTKGLCGTFNSNMQDDFLTPEGDVESSVSSFADKWRTKEKCQFAQNEMYIPHPCQLNIEVKEKAKKICEILKEKIFDECHWSVDPEPFYEDCIYDVCACQGSVSACVCPIFASYASECSRQGLNINWRHAVKECTVKCPAGQVFEECGDSCYRTCVDLQFHDQCTTECVEGCRCPVGQSLDENNECIPTTLCPCRYKGLTFARGYKEVRPGNKYLELCTCYGAVWKCREAENGDDEKYPPAGDLQNKCLSVNNEEFSTCEPIEPVTCKNMHSATAITSTSVAQCQAGCVCKKGFVLDSFEKRCVLPKDCSCHHGGKSYIDGEKILNECNSCVCKTGSWNCTKYSCPATCTAWGDSHFETFDGKDFDFQGVCNYVLSKGMLDNGNGFSVTIQNVLCGSLGVTCSKSITVSLLGDQPETIIFNSADKMESTGDTPIDKIKNISSYKAGIFTVIDLIGINVQIKWDHGTRVYVKLGTDWKNKVKGLCGNFNGDQQDDLKTPSSGIETSAVLFGDSWKLQDYCEKPTEQIDTCREHPERKIWSQRKCEILKTKLFEPCHSEVSVEKYLKRCTYDTCACDQGGDCECLCTAISAYAHACSMKGIPIKWRSNDLCPMQCDVHCSEYSPCVSTCPVETCDNLLDQAKDQRMCKKDTCIEGCQIKPCPLNEIYLNNTYIECVPKSKCKHICVDDETDVTYVEGEIVRSDDCHSCSCTRGKIICSGVPCTPITLPTPIPSTTSAATTVKTTTQKPCNDSEDQCKSGWSEWLNEDPIQNSFKDNTKKRLKISDYEPLPTLKLLKSLNQAGGSCELKFITDIECRTVDTHLSSKETGENVECSLERGLICLGPCHDFEIRIFCNCGNDLSNEIEIFTLPTTMPPIVTHDKKPIKIIEELTTTTQEPTHQVNNKCDPAIPHVEYPGDCYKFLHCEPSTGGDWKYAEKTCGPTMMFNPTAMVCDWIASVKAMKPECGDDVKPAIKPITTTIKPMVKQTTTPRASKCPPGYEWNDCAVPCGKACHYYGKLLYKMGTCTHASNICEEGCVESYTQISCPSKHLWRDNKICVDKSDCTCMSHNGKMIKPGAVFTESECEICQCIDNEYACDKSDCGKKPTTITYEEFIPKKNTVIILTTTNSPPLDCDENLVPMIDGYDPLPDSAFSSSTYLGAAFKPQFARLNQNPTADSGGSWAPEYNDRLQYLQITFDKPVPLFSAIIRGSPIFDQYVTSYKILHSYDDIAYHNLVDETGAPQIFRGSIDSQKPVESKFKIPIEAKSVRIIPITWHSAIAIRFELMGCPDKKKLESLVEAKTTTTEIPKTSTEIPVEVTTIRYVEHVFKPICDDPMGVDNGLLSPDQITVSSIKSKKLPPSDILKLSSTKKGWSPILSTPNEYVQFDFGDSRFVTGFQTKGGDYGWVSSYYVYYSPDNVVWNEIMDLYTGEPKLFLANYDSTSIKQNYFDLPINTRLIKLVPAKWYDTIELKVEPMGCFKPYDVKNVIKPSVTTPNPIEIITNRPDCGVCDNILEAPSLPIDGMCLCYPPLFWNGDKCVNKTECPCMVGHLSYEVGSHYELDDCSKCVCLIGGMAQCKQFHCPKCKIGLRPVKSTTCTCKCEPCPKKEVLCQTSGLCIPESAWCDGIVDCPDDEIGCANKDKEKPKIVTQVEETIKIIKTCPEPSCPPGYEIKERPKNERAPIKSSPMFQQTGVKTKSSIKSTKSNNSLPDNDEECIDFVCIPERPIIDPENPTKDKEKIECRKPTCPKGYDVILDNSLSTGGVTCVKFNCEPTVQNDAVCNVTGRTFNTFDGTEFKYDICDHVLAHDLVDGKWSINLIKNCTVGNYACTKELKIIDKEMDKVIVLYSDLTVSLDGYIYTAEQLHKSTFAKMNTFVISKVGNTLIFVSHLHGFWVIFDEDGDVKIGVTSKKSKQIDGLCGLFNGDPSDDKTLPSGKKVISSVEFGDGWLVNSTETSKLFCQPHACPKKLQDEAWEMCNSVKHETFKSCSKQIDIDRFLSKCLEQACECLMAPVLNNNDAKETSKKCKCAVLQNFVVDCLAADESIHLDAWRNIHECEAECAAPLIHRDCYRRRCEPSCDGINNAAKDDCPTIPGACFSGCYCPEGSVKKGSLCVPISECHDCVCDGFGQSQYITYDRKNFTFDGNCTYLLSRDLIVEDVYTFQIYVTLGSCGGVDDKKGTCTEALHILYGPHIIHLQKNPEKNSIVTFIDGIELKKLPLEKEWIQISEASGQNIDIRLPESQVSLTAKFDDMSFAIKVPSVKYGAKMEGLCGDCNGNPDDDLKLNPNSKNKNKSDNIERDIIQSWLADDPKLPKEEVCLSEETTNMDCIPLPPDDDPCLEIMNDTIFGQCHMIIDPMMYVFLCQEDMCKTGGQQLGACKYIANYAKECARNEICLDWKESFGGKCKDDNCATNMTYQICGCPKTCETVKQLKEIEKSQKASSISKNSFDLNELCTVPKIEGCFCRPGEVNQNGKCILESHCTPCVDDKQIEHYPGDKWNPDKCTDCECLPGGKSQCTKMQCSNVVKLCEIGWKEIEIENPEECCSTFKCIPDPKKCNETSLVPNCGPNQVAKKIKLPTGDGCEKYICECKPFDECEPLKVLELKLGEKIITDTTGCCPVHKIICDKSKCPERPTKCTDEFYEVFELEKLSPLEQCCLEFQCQPPKDKCIVDLPIVTKDGNKKELKKPGDVWKLLEKPCVTKKCNYDSDGKPIVEEIIEKCNEKLKCDPGSELLIKNNTVAGSAQCCPTCVQTKCVFDEKIYNFDEKWQSNDNCTSYKCIEMNDEFIVTSMKETCPDVSDCPDYLRYFKGCCQYCKQKTEDLKNCLATSLSDKETIKLIEKPTKKHGMCRNMAPIHNFTECNGACPSGTKYNKMTYKQSKICECCQVNEYNDITVPLTCENGFILDLIISLPKSCSCQQCEEHFGVKAMK